MKVNQKQNSPDKNLRLGFMINTTFVVAEFIAGLLSNSLALVSDAAHNLTDSMSILFAFFASRFSRRKANDKQTYGYGRAAILAALINSTILVVTSITIYREAYERLHHPEPVQGGVVALIAGFGILCNGAVAFIASRNKGDLNSRAVFLGNIVDTISSLSAMVAGIVIIFTKQTWIDPAISFFIATMLLVAAWEIIRQAVGVLMESVPKDVDLEKIRQAILSTPNVTALDDLHVWAISSGYNALSCHIAVEQAQMLHSRSVIEAIKAKLKDNNNIQHATIEVELSGSQPHIDQASNPH